MSPGCNIWISNTNTADVGKAFANHGGIKEKKKTLWDVGFIGKRVSKQHSALVCIMLLECAWETMCIPTPMIQESSHCVTSLLHLINRLWEALAIKTSSIFQSYMSCFNLQERGLKKKDEEYNVLKQTPVWPVENNGRNLYRGDGIKSIHHSHLQMNEMEAVLFFVFF